MSLYPMVKVALDSDRSGSVIAVTEPEDAYHSGPSLVVGTVRRQDSGTWRAWLWPETGGALHISQSCNAVEAPTSDALTGKLRKRVAKDGAWWT